jgi:DNA-binding response OmpR family regulator
MKHALVIENNHLIAMMIEQELSESGYDTVQVAVTQEQAIAMAKDRCPQLITADDKLDSGSGIDAIREICRDQAIPVVFIAARIDQIALSIPDAVIVQKPFSRMRLMAAIERAGQAPTAFPQFSNHSQLDVGNAPEGGTGIKAGSRAKADRLSP